MNIADFSNTSACTSTSTTPAGALALERLAEAKRLLDAIEPEPFGEFMRSKGCDPANGWVWLFPNTPEYAEIVNMPMRPRYLMLHNAITEPMMVMSPSLRPLNDLRLFGYQR